MPPPNKLEALASEAVAALLARGDEGYLAEVVAGAPLSLINPCLASLDEVALAAVEDACCSCSSAAADEDDHAESPRDLLEIHWKRLFLQRFGGKNAAQQLKGNSSLRWRARFEAAKAAAKEKMAQLGLKLRAREREEEARKRSRSVVVLEAPPRPLNSSSSPWKISSNNKRHAIDSRQRLAKKLASGSMATTTTRTKIVPLTVAATATRKSAAAAPAPPFPNLARPLVKPGNEAQRVVVAVVRRASGSSSGSGCGEAAAAVARPRPRELEEVDLFAD